MLNTSKDMRATVLHAILPLYHPRLLSIPGATYFLFASGAEILVIYSANFRLYSILCPNSSLTTCTFRAVVTACVQLSDTLIFRYLL